jgi:Ca2+/Na+ antiporter
MALLVTSKQSSTNYCYVCVLIIFFSYAALIWIYTTAKEIVNVILAFGVVFQVGSLILGVTILAIGIGMQDLVTCVGVARAGNFFFGDCIGMQELSLRALVLRAQQIFLAVFWRLPIGIKKTLSRACVLRSLHVSAYCCLPPPLRRSCYAPAQADEQACHSAD